MREKPSGFIKKTMEIGAVAAVLGAGEMSADAHKKHTPGHDKHHSGQHHVVAKREKAVLPAGVTSDSLNDFVGTLQSGTDVERTRQEHARSEAAIKYAKEHTLPKEDAQAWLEHYDAIEKLVAHHRTKNLSPEDRAQTVGAIQNEYNKIPDAHKGYAHGMLGLDGILGKYQPPNSQTFAHR